MFRPLVNPETVMSYYFAEYLPANYFNSIVILLDVDDYKSRFSNNCIDDNWNYQQEGVEIILIFLWF